MMMKAATLSAALATTLIALVGADGAAFAAWRVQHGKEYGSVVEAARRQQVFEQNLVHFAERNRNDGDTFFSTAVFSCVCSPSFASIFTARCL
jgi:hypothetical protein